MPPKAINAIDKDGCTALMYAVISKNEEIVKMLLPKMTQEAIDASDKEGKTALHWTFSHPSVEIITLLTHHMSPEVVADAILDSQAMGLRRAASAGDEKELVDLIAKVNHPKVFSAVDKDGRTALHLAAEKGHKGACKLLLPKMPPQSIKARDTNGNTASDIASNKGYREICNLLSQTQEFSDTAYLIPKQSQEDCCGCTLFPIFKIKYNNPLLNKPELLDTALTKFSLNSVLNLSQGIPDNLLSQIISNNDAELLLGALMSLDASI